MYVDLIYLEKDNDEVPRPLQGGQDQVSASQVPFLTYWVCGTLIHCRSQNIHKYVRYLSEMCQKTVIYKNLSENCLNCVRYLSEICQIHISVTILSEKIWKCLRNVSEVINVSENSHCVIQITVINLS